MLPLLSALRKAARDLGRPSVLRHALWPPVIAALGGAALGVLALAPARDALARATSAEGALGRGLITAALVLTLVGLAYAATLVLLSAFALPRIVAEVAAREHPELIRRGDLGPVKSAAHAALAAGLFLAGWAVTWPLLLAPGGLLAVPLAWSAWLNQRTLPLDALGAHATREERARLATRTRGSRWAAAILTAAIAYVPLLNLLAPVFAALVFAHLCLGALARLRAEDR